MRKSQRRESDGVAAALTQNEVRTKAIMAAIQSGNDAAAIFLLNGGASNGKNGGKGQGRSKRERDSKAGTGGRLPEGQLCKAGTCHFNHDALSDGAPLLPRSTLERQAAQEERF